MSPLRVGINGFGRIGRLIFRSSYKNKRMKIVAVNNLSSPSVSAHLLKYDSVHGVFPETVTSTEKSFSVGGEEVFFSSYRDPSQIPWNEWDVDIVFECSGIFKKRSDLEKHFSSRRKSSSLKTGKKGKKSLNQDSGQEKKLRILVSAPASGADVTLVFGVNHSLYDPLKHEIVSNASCTTNCLAPLVSLLKDNFGIEKGFMTTVHSYTNDQRVLDSSHKDLRRARAATLSMIPTSTGATKAVSQIFPELEGSLKGMAIRVPTPNVSLIDFVFVSRKGLDVEAIHRVFKEGERDKFKGILKFETLPLVSSDFTGSAYSTIVDSQSTMTLGSHMAKIVAWYDNEMGFSHRMIDLGLYMYEKGICGGGS